MLVELAMQCCDYEPDDRPPAGDAMGWAREMLGDMPDEVRPEWCKHLAIHLPFARGLPEFPELPLLPVGPDRARTLPNLAPAAATPSPPPPPPPALAPF